MTLTAQDHVARSMLVAAVRSRSADFRRLAGWSVLEALPTFLSGLLVAQALNSFLRSDLRAGLSWLGVFAVSVLVGVWGTRRAMQLLAAVVEPFRDDLVTGVVQGAMRRSTRPGASPHTSDVAVLTEQVEIVREAYAASLMITQQFLVVVVSALVGLLALDPVIVLFVLPPLVVALVVFALALGRMAKQQRASIQADEALSEKATIVSSGIRDVIACGAQDVVTVDIEREIEAHARATSALGRLSAVGTVAIAIGSWLPLLLVLGFGRRLVADGASAGVIVGAATYLLQGLQPAMQTLVHGLSGPGLWLMVTMRRVVSVMDREPGVDEAREPSKTEAGAGSVAGRGAGPGADRGAGLGAGSKPRDDLVLSGITFRYSEWSAPVVEDFDLTVAYGDHLTIVGPSGAGKSTLAGLMAGLLVPQRGDVRVGGVDVRRMAASTLADGRVLIPQEAYVFDGSVRDNLGYLRAGLETVELDRAVDLLGARDLVDRLGGLDVGLDQGALSSGERQLITLVRAYVSAAGLVVLDEATCYLDPQAEAVVERAFADRPGSLVVIAHRISSALRARRVLVLDGAEVALGTNDELVASSALYRDLVGRWSAAPVVPSAIQDRS